jgi:hypothetical protein
MEEEDAEAAEQRRADVKAHVAARGAAEGWPSSVGEGWPIAEGGVELVGEAALTLHLVSRQPSDSSMVVRARRGGAGGRRRRLADGERKQGRREMDGVGWGMGDKK